MSSAAMSELTEALTIMSPSTTRICLTAFEATKDWCLDVPNIDAIKADVLRFYHEVGGSNRFLLNAGSPVALE